MRSFCAARPVLFSRGQHAPSAEPVRPSVQPPQIAQTVTELAKTPRAQASQAAPFKSPPTTCYTLKSVVSGQHEPGPVKSAGTDASNTSSASLPVKALPAVKGPPVFKAAPPTGKPKPPIVTDHEPPPPRGRAPEHTGKPKAPIVTHHHSGWPPPPEHTGKPRAPVLTASPSKPMATTSRSSNQEPVERSYGCQSQDSNSDSHSRSGTFQ